MAGNSIWKDTVDNTEQSSTSPIFGYYMMETLKTDISLTLPALTNATTVTLSEGHGFVDVADQYILIYENDHLLQQEITISQISGNIITLKTPIDIPFTTNAIVYRGNINLAKDFSGSNAIDSIFSILDGTIPIDLSEVILSIYSAGVPDDGKFGGIAQLTNGVYFRQLDGRNVNLGNYKSNQEFRDRGGEITYTDKAPSSEYATTIRFKLKDTFDQVLRINPRENCYFLSHLRDDFESLTRFTMSLLGSYTVGE